MPRWKRRSTDPWDRVLSEHITSQTAADGSRSSLRTLDRRWLIGGAATLALLLVAVGVLSALTVINNGRASESLERAEEWRDRSEQLSDLVSERTRALNRQTARLNVASNRLRSARRSVQRSEADVATLEQRQSELADEKAAIEDERALLEGEQQALSTAAAALASCNDSLVGIINTIGAGLAPTDGEIDSANLVCSEAEALAEGITL